ncbi:aldolase/citrate lyase family protein [Natronorubrum halophilum]|uniref:aldolase/citrate lyase family protein n=1 Tax=Natronorubrum halophilum TaxID=1702106 RepID=UPI0030B8189F
MGLDLENDYVANEDDSTLIGVAIESPNAVTNIESILDVPTLGFVFIWPFDISVALGHPTTVNGDYPRRRRPSGMGVGPAFDGWTTGRSSLSVRRENGLERPVSDVGGSKATYPIDDGPGVEL